MMFSCILQRLSSSLLVFAFVVSTAWAQQPSPQFDSSEPEKQVSEDSETQDEKNADVRDAVLENLDLKEIAEESYDSEDVSPQPESDDASVDQEALPPGEEEEEWYNRFSILADKMQNIPYLSDRGWLHFGRVEFEYANFSNSELLSEESGFNFRSLRTGIIKLFDKGTIVKLDIDLTDGESNITDMYVRFSTKLGLFTLGNQKVALSLVNQTSRLARTFMEEPLPAEAFGLIRRLGAGWDFHRKKVGVHLTAFGPDFNEQVGKFGYGLRMYTNPTRTPWSMTHIGISGVREDVDDVARFRARPESRVTDVFLVDTGKNPDVDTQSIYSFEAAVANKNWAVRGEYFYTQWERDTQKNANFSGYYLQANWVLTGESFQYKQGKFLRIRPDSSKGAWEVALRYSAVNLNEQNIFGGAEKNTTLALNWYSPGYQLRIQSNLIYVNTDSVAGNENSLIFQVRAQIHW